MANSNQKKLIKKATLTSRGAAFFKLRRITFPVSAKGYACGHPGDLPPFRWLY